MNNYTTFVSILVEILKKQQHFSGHDYLMAAKSFVAQWYPSALSLFHEKELWFKSQISHCCNYQIINNKKGLAHGQTNNKGDKISHNECWNQHGN